MNFYQLLKIFRKKKEYTQKEMADKLWIRHNTYSQYENEKRKIDIETYIKLADELDIEVMAFSPKNEKLDEKYTKVLNLNDGSFQTWINHCFDNEQIVYSLFYMNKEFIENFLEKLEKVISKGRFMLILEIIQHTFFRNNSKTLRKAQFAREELMELLSRLIEEGKIENVF